MQDRELEVESRTGQNGNASKLSLSEMFHQHRSTGINRHLCDSCYRLRLEDLYDTPGRSRQVRLLRSVSGMQKQECILCQLIAKIIGRHRESSGRETLTEVKVHLKTCTKEVVIQDNDKNYICSLEVGHNHNLSPSPNGQPALRSQPIVWSDINDWLRRWKAPEVLKEQPPGFRVIDVEKFCVVPAPPLCEYVALSYVWGDKPGQFQAKSSNIGLLECHGSLSKPEVPTTIKDAMYVCSCLNKKYLWVDRFCIVHDHPSSRDVQINAMGSIYSHSFVTLVAMEGHDADFGICGVSKDRMYEISFKKGRIAEIYESFRLDKPRWTWMSRGWTLQESVLSTRLLIFTEKSLYFKDSGVQQFRRDLNSDLHLEEYIDVTPIRSKDSLWWYSRNVNDYTKRTLGDPQDTLRAFTGIMSSLFGKRHLFGLPFAHFVEALLWYPTGHANLRNPEGENKFPTWSWVSNTSPVEFQNCLLTIASCAVTVSAATSGQREWSVISIAGLPTNNFSNLKSGNLSMALKLARKMALADEPIFELEKNNFDRNIGSTEEKLLRKFSLDNNQCDSQLGHSWDRISIHTQKVRLVLDPQIHQVSPERIMIILRSSKSPVGFLFLDSIEREESILPRLRDGEEIFMDSLALGINFFSMKRHVNSGKFNTTAAVYNGHLKSEDIRREMIQGNSKAFNFLPPELVSLCAEHNDIFTLHVMAVEKSNSDIFRRIGLGQIFLEKWGELDPEVGAFMIE